MTTGFMHQVPLASATALLRRAGLATLCVLTLGNAADAANRARQYDFEGGVVGETTTTIADSIDTMFFEPIPNNPGLAWIDVPGNAPRRLPAGGMMDSVDSVIQITPPMNTFSGAGTYVDVSAGSGLELPAQNRTPSDIALRFDGNTSFENFDPNTNLGGMRGVFINVDDYNANNPVVGGGEGTNTFENFSLFTQAWVWPDSAAEGTEQVVFQSGTQHGTMTISSDGFWQTSGLGIAAIESTVPVQFDTWNHVAIFRGGGDARMYVNGGLAGRSVGSFGQFAPNIVLGSGEFNDRPFTGLIDNFALSGTGDLSFNPSVDLDINATPPPGDCDIDQSGVCDQADYDIWNDNFGFDNGFGAGDIFTYDRGDADVNGRVDFFDFKIIAEGVRAEGNTLTVAGVPEPTGLGLLSLAGVAATAAGRRRKVA